MTATLKDPGTALQAVNEPVSESAALMSVIHKAAVDPAVDVGKMERLFALFREMDHQRREDAYNTAMKAAQAAMPQMFRDKKNEHKGYKYTTLEELNSAAVPIYTSHGFALSFGTLDCPLPGHYRMTCKVSHADGLSRDYQADLPTDMVGDKGAPNKTAIQGFGSSMSYGRRYLTMMIFNISTTDDNDGGHTVGGKITPDQAAQLAKIVADNEFDDLVFLKWAGVESYQDIDADKFGKAFNALQAKVKAKAAAK